MVRSSPTFGHWAGYVSGAERGRPKADPSPPWVGTDRAPGPYAGRQLPDFRAGFQFSFLQLELELAQEIGDPSFDPNALITLEQAGAMLGVTAERIRVLIKDGFIAKPARGRVTVSGAAKGYARYWQDKATDQTRSSASSRVSDARAAEIEQRIAMRNRDLAPIDELEEAFDFVVGVCVEGWSALPAMITRDMEERTRIEGIVKMVQGRVAKHLGQAADAVRIGTKLPDLDL